MRKIALLTLLIISTTGCNAFKRFLPQGAGQETSGPAPTPNDYTVTGVTSSDYQTVSPVRVADSGIVVKVKRQGEGWSDCNEFETTLSSAGAAGGFVKFNRIAYPTYNQKGDLLYLVLTSTPVAPAGTQYEIHSVKRST